MMLRRDMLKAVAATGSLAVFGRSALAAPPGWREFKVA